MPFSISAQLINLIDSCYWGCCLGIPYHKHALPITSRDGDWLPGPASQLEEHCKTQHYFGPNQHPSKDIMIAAYICFAVLGDTGIRKDVQHRSPIRLQTLSLASCVNPLDFSGHAFLQKCGPICSPGN